MKNIIVLLTLTFFSLFFINENNVNAQASCSGTVLASTVGNWGSSTRFGNGTAGCIRVCITNNAIGTAACMGSSEQLILSTAAGSGIVAQWYSTTANSTCYTFTSNTGYGFIGKYCWGASSEATLTWTTVNCSTGADVCCTVNCSNGIQDCGEACIDAGGPCPSPCPGVASCSDAIQNQDETGVDCGGTICVACGTPCTTWSSPTMTPAAGSIIDASTADQTITTCVSISYSNASTNWVHGVYQNPSSTGFVSSTGTSAPAAVSNMGTTYTWTNTTANFTSSNSGNTITARGWFVETGNTNRGDNLGWPVGANTLIGPFCFSTVVGCAGLTGDVAATIGFATTADSYSGSWTSNGCGLNTSVGTAAQMSYTLRCPVLLPIELSAFTGTSLGRINQLNWEIGAKENKSHFVVLRSDSDGKNWIEVATVSSKDHLQSSSLQFEAFDEKPTYGVNFYKLQQFDFDGNFEESHVISVFNELDHDLLVIPNPVQDNATIVYYSGQNISSKISIYDITGKVISVTNVETFKGVNNINFETNDLVKGTYLIRLESSLHTKTVMFSKIK